MKKTIFVAVIIGIIAAVALFWGRLFLFHSMVIESGNNYPEEEILSDNGEYLLRIERVEDEYGVASMTFSIKTADGGEVLFTCPEVYRAYDLHGISWDGEDVVVNSGDVGSYRYAKAADGWAERAPNSGK